jgi:hypothetical protein
LETLAPLEVEAPVVDELLFVVVLELDLVLDEEELPLTAIRKSPAIMHIYCDYRRRLSVAFIGHR